MTQMTQKNKLDIFQGNVMRRNRKSQNRIVLESGRFASFASPASQNDDAKYFVVQSDWRLNGFTGVSSSHTRGEALMLRRCTDARCAPCSFSPSLLPTLPDICGANLPSRRHGHSAERLYADGRPRGRCAPVSQVFCPTEI